MAQTEAEPKTVKQALASKDASKWTQSMAKKLASLTDNRMWKITQQPKGCKIIGSCFVFKHKIGANGKITRYKSRLVAQGFKQIYMIDYKETFAAIVSFVTIRILFTLAVHMN